MKKQNLRTFVMFGVFAILAVAPLRAQASREQTANIPFSFAVADKTFPAGEYRVRRLNPSSDKAALAIKSATGRISKIVLMMPVQAGKILESAKLVFNHYGDQYFLAQVWTPADDTGLACAPIEERTLALTRRWPPRAGARDHSFSTWAATKRASAKRGIVLGDAGNNSGGKFQASRHY